MEGERSEFVVTVTDERTNERATKNFYPITSMNFATERMTYRLTEYSFDLVLHVKKRRHVDERESNQPPRRTIFLCRAHRCLLIDVGHDHRHDDRDRLVNRTDVTVGRIRTLIAYRETHDDRQIDTDDWYGVGRGRYFLRHHEHEDGKGNETRETQRDLFA